MRIANETLIVVELMALFVLLENNVEGTILCLSEMYAALFQFDILFFLYTQTAKFLLGFVFEK